MKKYLGSLIAAIMMAAGLVAFTGTTATAACPYTGCIETSTRVTAQNPVERFHRAHIDVKVTTGGNGVPKGRVTIFVRRALGGYKFTDSMVYTGGEVTFTTTKLAKLGKYIATVRFDRKAGSAFTDSDNVDTFRVVR